jgi:hypothetical protein
VTLGGNRIWGKGEAEGIVLELVKLPEIPGEVHRDIRIVANSITGFAGSGIQISTNNTSERIDGLEISGNDISAGGTGLANLTGVRFPPPGNGTGDWVKRALVTGNRITDDVQFKIERHGPTVPFLTISGNSDAVAIFEGDGTPEGVVPSPPGSIFLSVGNATGATAYLKTAGTDVFGWVQLATVP